MSQAIADARTVLLDPTPRRVFKLDYALEEIAAAKADVARGRAPGRPFVPVVQQSPFDGTRAPDSAHTLRADCHLPHGPGVDMRRAIERQIERLAPGFRDVIHLALRLSPYTTPNPQVFICSSSTPPGVGVDGRHGSIAAPGLRGALR